ncbi:solute carrier family 2, facilitated glucose transporter member 7 [Tachyglossus aculeatus]|uniref:solute carrier family 2, facilitated glucose transporter member 7 n=1 Tax=Tachyglossus aculeatus TaxID=9261 RepID=UPI0018F71029|nr:solute carrier family 2, facilitated glucose transporter member 7 [Tachyglossus aculeatus]
MDHFLHRLMSPWGYVELTTMEPGFFTTAVGMAQSELRESGEFLLGLIGQQANKQVECRTLRKTLRGVHEQDPYMAERLTLTLALATLTSAFGSAFQYGYNISVVNTPHKVIKAFYNETYFEKHKTFLDESSLLLLWSITVSMFPLGGLLGSLMVGPLVDKCGRKRTLLINNIFAIVPAILMGTSKVAKSYEMIIFSRVIVGICAGVAYSALPMYLGELSLKNLRGLLGTMTEVFVITGIFLAQIFSLEAVLGTTAGWPVLLAITGIPAGLQLLFLPFFPESPRFTLIQKGDEERARQDLQKLRGWDDVEDEVEEMHLEEQEEKAEGRLSILNLFTFRSLRWQLISIIVLMAGQQLSGVNAINYYADTIYTSAGVDPAHTQYVTVGAGIINIIMTVVSAFIVELWGRRTLLLAGYGICGMACAVLTVALLFQSTVPELSYLGVICIFFYIAGHSIGPSPVPSVVRTEIFLQSSRPAAFMVDGAVHWLTNFVVGLVFPFVQEGIGPYSFIIFTGICLLTALYIHVVIPETKGKTFVEINRIFAERNKVEIPGKTEGTTDARPSPPPLPSRETAF